MYPLEERRWRCVHLVVNVIAGSGRIFPVSTVNIAGVWGGAGHPRNTGANSEITDIDHRREWLLDPVTDVAYLPAARSGQTFGVTRGKKGMVIALAVPACCYSPDLYQS